MLDKLKGYAGTVGRSIRSKTVLTAAAGFGVHYCVRKNYLPDVFFTQALEGASYVLCAIFRVAATTDLKSGGGLS